jgi:hypothetical protein
MRLDLTVRDLVADPGRGAPAGRLARGDVTSPTHGRAGFALRDPVLPVDRMHT